MNKLFVFIDGEDKLRFASRGLEKLKKAIIKKYQFDGPPLRFYKRDGIVCDCEDVLGWIKEVEQV
jgi:hypothetical protein